MKSCGDGTEPVRRRIDPVVGLVATVTREDPASADAEFETFVREYQDRLHRAAFLMVGDRHRAQDVVQTALAQLYTAWPRRASWDHPYAYARQAVVNVVLRQGERRWWGETPTDQVPEPGDRPSVAPSNDDRRADDDLADRDQLRRALAELPVRQRTAVVLRYYVDLSEADTATAMRCPPGTVKSLTARGLSALRAGLEGETS